MKKILLPTDFSENAFNAIRYALRLYENETCTFYLLNTYTPISYHDQYLLENQQMYQLEDISRENSEKGLEIIIEKIKEEFQNPRHHFIHRSAFNTLIDEALQVVDNEGIDLIVMGTKGATGAKEIFMGTHTMYMIKKAKCPVIAVPEEYAYITPKEILFPTDYNLNTDNTALSFIKEISTNHQTKLTMLYAYYGLSLSDYQEETKVFLDEYFKENTHTFHITDGMDVIEAIEDYQKKNPIHLLAMIHNKHSFFDNLLFKPVVNQIVYHTNVPFLVIPSMERMSK